MVSRHLLKEGYIDMNVTFVKDTPLVRGKKGVLCKECGAKAAVFIYVAKSGLGLCTQCMRRLIIFMQHAESKV